jgi:hypothetical protein
MNQKRDNYTVELTLTQFEAPALMSVLIHSVIWSKSAEFGLAARDVYVALLRAGVSELREWAPKFSRSRPLNAYTVSRLWEGPPPDVDVVGDSYEVVLTLTPFEAKVIASVMMRSVLWSESGELGEAADAIHNALYLVAGESQWEPVREDNDICTLEPNTTSRIWRAL